MSWDAPPRCYDGDHAYQVVLDCNGKPVRTNGNGASVTATSHKIWKKRIDQRLSGFTKEEGSDCVLHHKQEQQPADAHLWRSH